MSLAVLDGTEKEDDAIAKVYLCHALSSSLQTPSTLEVSMLSESGSPAR